MNGPELLEHAADVVTRRRWEYGEPVDLFGQVAKRWSLTLGTEISPLVVLCFDFTDGEAIDMSTRPIRRGSGHGTPER